jgi:dihydrolipoamide dehydrogenase
MKYDIVVIGSGPGGYVAAIKAAQNGMKTAIVEAAELGGVCLNWGCIPTKALLRSAQVFTSIKNAAAYGIEIDNQPVASLEKIVTRSRAVADTMSRGVAFLLKKNNIDVIQGWGRLVANSGETISDTDSVGARKSGREVSNTGATVPHTVSVTASDGTETRLQADHVILATGSRPREMPFMPIDGRKVISSKQALTMSELPESMVVVGSGAIGCEFAYFYAALGTKVTIIEYLPQLLPYADEEVSRTLERSFRKMKIGVMVSATVHKVDVNSDNKCEVVVESKGVRQTLTADVVLSAVGIKSNLECVGLEEVGVTVENDKVLADIFGFTNVNGIYAIGDITVGASLAHVASAEAIRCVEKICGHSPTPIDYSTIPSCVYTVPEVAMVGLTERQAIESGHEIRVGRFPFTASGKATAAGDRDGFVKLIFDAETDKLLGAHMVGAGVTEMLAEPTLVRAIGLTAGDILSTIHAHPTMSEAVMEAAEAATGQAIHL